MSLLGSVTGVYFNWISKTQCNSAKTKIRNPETNRSLPPPLSYSFLLLSNQSIFYISRLSAQRVDRDGGNGKTDNMCGSSTVKRLRDTRRTGSRGLEVACCRCGLWKLSYSGMYGHPSSPIGQPCLVISPLIQVSTPIERFEPTSFSWIVRPINYGGGTASGGLLTVLYASHLLSEELSPILFPTTHCSPPQFSYGASSISFTLSHRTAAMSVPHPFYPLDSNLSVM